MDEVFPSPLEGEAGNASALPGGGWFAQRREDYEQYSLGIGQHLVVPESDDSIAAQFEPACACLAFGRMLAAIDLDNEFRFRTKKIDNVTADWLLSTEPEAGHLLAAQTGPQSNLGIGGLGAQDASECGYHAAMLTPLERLGHPPPGLGVGLGRPPPQGGRGLRR
jgi:hypothetical protein